MRSSVAVRASLFLCYRPGRRGIWRLQHGAADSAGDVPVKLYWLFPLCYRPGRCGIWRLQHGAADSAGDVPVKLYWLFPLCYRPGRRGIRRLQHGAADSAGDVAATATGGAEFAETPQRLRKVRGPPTLHSGLLTRNDGLAGVSWLLAYDFVAANPRAATVIRTRELNLPRRN